MGFIKGTLVLTQGGYKPIEQIEPNDHVQGPMGALYRIIQYTIIPYIGDIYRLTTEYQYHPILCTGEQFVVVRNSPSGYKPVNTLTKGDWIGIWCPYHPSSPLPVIYDTLIPTYDDALFIQFCYLSHRRAVKILETYDHRYLCVETSEPLTDEMNKTDIWFEESYVWMRVLSNHNLLMRDTVYHIEVEGGNRYVVQGILV